jgi:1,2-dihydroxy-3-keto-5-methylthiopentene dioxygenase
MTAIATFDHQGQWLSTSVCEGATCPLARALGVSWGRCPVVGDDVARAEVEVLRSRELAGLRRRLGAHVSERIHIGPPPHAGVHAVPPPVEIAGENPTACVFLQGTALLSLRTPEGFTCLLLDAGEWVLLPAGVTHVFDVGESPDVSFLRLSAGRRGWFPLPTGQPLPPALPAKDAFVDQLLMALGEEIEE